MVVVFGGGRRLVGGGVRRLVLRAIVNEPGVGQTTQWAKRTHRV